MPQSGHIPRSYADISKLVGREAYNQALAYLSWHNRIPMTHMLTVWQALVVAMAAEQKPLDPLAFSTVQEFFKATTDSEPDSLEDCRRLGEQLAQRLG